MEWMDEGNRRLNNIQGRWRYRRLRNKLNKAADEAKKEYLETTICDKITEFQRTGHYDLMYMKAKELGWKENHGIQHIHIEGSQGNIIVDKRQVDEYRKFGRTILQSSSYLLTYSMEQSPS